MKKSLVILMCLVLLSGCIAGCGATKQSSASGGSGNFKMLLTLAQADDFRTQLVNQA